MCIRDSIYTVRFECDAPVEVDQDEESFIVPAGSRCTIRAMEPALLTGWYDAFDKSRRQLITADKTYSFVATEKRIIAPDYAEGTDLSAAGTANSYIAPRMQEIYLFDATVQGNGRATTGITPQKLKGTSARLIWQTGTAERAVVCDVGYNGSRISFRTGTAIGGNALIGLFDKDGDCIWSWHIWVTAYDPAASAQTYTGGAVFMDRNLGALNNTPMDVGNRGMFYEWGRKDPFTPSRSPYHANTDGNNVPAYNEPNTAIGDGTGTWVYNAQAAVLATPPANIPNSILNPMTYLQSPYNGHADWYCTGTDPKATHPGLWGPEKTIFDPCPPGYKVPGPDLWGIPAGNNSITNGGAAADYDETGVSVKWDWNAYEDCGRRWKNTGDYYPMAGNIYYTDYISVSICNYTGGMAFYWTAQATPDATKSSAYFVNFNPNWCNYRLREHDCSAQIRCIRE